MPVLQLTLEAEPPGAHHRRGGGSVGGAAPARRGVRMRGPALATTSRQLQPQHPRRGLLGAPPPPAQGLSSTSSSTTTTTTTTTASLGAGSSLLRPTAAARKRAPDEASLRRQRKNDREDRRWEEPSVAWVHTIRPTAEDDAAAQEGSSGERQASLPVTEQQQNQLASLVDHQHTGAAAGGARTTRTWRGRSAPSKRRSGDGIGC